MVRKESDLKKNNTHTPTHASVIDHLSVRVEQGLRAGWTPVIVPVRVLQGSCVHRVEDLHTDEVVKLERYRSNKLSDTLSLACRATRTHARTQTQTKLKPCDPNCKTREV